MTTSARLAAGVLMLCLWSGSASADWRLTPLFGVDAGSSTGFVDLEGTVGHPHPVYGVAVNRTIRRALGIEAEGTIAPRFFGSDDLIRTSRVSTGTVGVTFALPGVNHAHPYALIGGGFVRNDTVDARSVFPGHRTLPAFTAGAGVWIPAGARIQVRVDVRFTRTSTGPDNGLGSVEFLEMWRIATGITLRL
jgi:hypothetical protein